MEILGIDPTVEAKVVAEAIQSCLKEETASEVTVTVSKKPFRGTTKAFVRLEEARALKGVSSSVAHKKGGFLGFFSNMKTAREKNVLLRIFEHIFIQQ